MSQSPRGSARPTRPAPAPSLSFRQRHPKLVALIPLALVLVVLVTLVVVKVTGGSSPALASSPHLGSTASSHGASALPSGVLSAVTSVPAATLTTVGRPSGLALPAKVTGHPTTLTGTDGKPEVLYIGAEYCPYCAAERWALVEALSRFGTFSGLKATHSSTSDVFPDTKTFSFVGSTFTSSYLDFVSVEEATNQPDGAGYATLEVPTAAEQQILADDDTSPYTSSPGSIPFLDIGGHYLFIGASYNPQLLAGLSMQAIATDLANPSSQVAQAIDGTANEITAAISTLTGDQPAAVGDSPTISAIVRALGS